MSQMSGVEAGVCEDPKGLLFNNKGAVGSLILFKTLAELCEILAL